MSSQRAGEHGLSVIEALIVTAITAILIMLILPMAPTSMRRDYGLAARTIATGAAVRGEAGFQSALRSVVQPAGIREVGVVEPIIQGDRFSFAGAFAASQDSACLPAGAGGVVTVRIERRDGGGTLMCRGEGGAVELLRWANGDARLAYSADGMAWRDAWPVRRRERTEPGVSAPSRSVLVRFQLQSTDFGAVEWIGRAGFTEPVEIAPLRAEDPADASAP